MSGVSVCGMYRLEVEGGGVEEDAGTMEQGEVEVQAVISGISLVVPQ